MLYICDKAFSKECNRANIPCVHKKPHLRENIDGYTCDSFDECEYDNFSQKVKCIKISEHKKIVEKLAAKVHDAWWEEKVKQGFHAPIDCSKYPSDGDKENLFKKFCEKCHPDMYTYEMLSDNIKEYDRQTVLSVLNALEKI